MDMILSGCYMDFWINHININKLEPDYLKIDLLYRLVVSMDVYVIIFNKLSVILAWECCDLEKIWVFWLRMLKLVSLVTLIRDVS